jgi:hypothetical protein
MQTRHTLLLCVIVYFAAACCRDKNATTLPVEPEIRSLINYTNGQAIALLHGADTLALRVETERDSIEVACDGDCCERFFQGSYLVKFKKTDNTNFAEMTASSTSIVFDAINTRFASFSLDENKRIACDPVQGILCLDSLVVGTQTYRNLWRITAATTTANSPTFLYYNKTNGIVKITMRDGVDYLLP